MSPSPPLLSVVVASVESARTLDEALGALRASTAGMDVEIWVADASSDGSARLAAAYGTPVRLIEREPGILTPVLWADGIRRSTGTYVALTTGHCVVPPGWARALVEALSEGAAAAGAGLVPLPTASPLDRAICYLRYAGFLDLTTGPARPVPELPGDNAAYQGVELRAFASGRSDGFWELDYHRMLRARGGSLVAVPGATAGFGRSFPLSTILRHRFEHGRHFGAWRVGGGGESAARVVLPAPLVPFALLARAGRQAMRRAGHRRAFLGAAPAFLALATAWAAGEATGALAGPERGPGRAG